MRKNTILRKSYYSQPCAACGRQGSDPAHIKSFGSGGEDASDNMMPLCRQHHSEQHQSGWRKFTQNYPAVLVALTIRGWTIDYLGKLKKSV